MASQLQSILSLDQALSDDDFRLLSEGESREGKGEGIYALSSKPSVDPIDEVDLGRAVTTKIASGECCPVLR